MRVVQGFGGAMMTPVGRLILLRSFPRSGLVSAMNWMTIPAMIGPTVGPIVGGFLTTYFSWRAIFYLNVPIGITGVVLALCLIENFRAPAPTRFDLRGFFLAGFRARLSPIRHRKSRTPDRSRLRLGALLFPAAFAILLLYIWHARQREDPILDLRLLRIRTFRVGTVTGSLCRMGLDAMPFLLPLFFQVGFGLSPLHAGLLTFSSSLGAMLVRTFSGAFLRVFGFRRLLAGNACLAAAVTAACGLLRADTPVWLIVVLRSAVRLRAQHSVSWAQHDQLRRRPRPAAEQEHQRRRRRPAIGERLWHRRRRCVARGHRRPARVTVGDFQLAFFLIALLPLLSALGFLRLSPVDGAEVSGHRRAQPRSA